MRFFVIDPIDGLYEVSASSYTRLLRALDRLTDTPDRLATCEGFGLLQVADPR